MRGNALASVLAVSACATRQRVDLDRIGALLDLFFSEQLDDIMAGKEPRPPKDWTPRTPPSGSGGSGGSPVAADPSPTAA